ncbi:MAG: rRNA pseudouridine synthase [Deltaproteobacteria bacterium]|nr:rRNA pseudouridine synthase [Deltaproteobacteria bacterium]
MKHKQQRPTKTKPRRQTPTRKGRPKRTPGSRTFSPESKIPPAVANFPETPFNPEEPWRLNRLLSSAGLTSRRKADQWILSGRITVNGKPVNALGTTAFWGRDDIRVDGQKIPLPPQKVYLMLNKPFGTICSLNDPEGRPLVTDLIKDIPIRVYPVGRLDFDTLGLLLLTNDGEFAHRLTHPRFHVPKTYKVTVQGAISDEALKRLQTGITLNDGPAGRARTELINRNNEKSILRMTITQGKSRQVRRMLEEVGFTVIHLIRISFGTLQLGDLKIGHHRYLDSEELSKLKKMAGLA